MQLKSGDSSVSCSVVFHQVSTSVSSINPLTHCIYWPEATAVRASDVWCWGRGEALGYPSGCCPLFSLSYQKIGWKTCGVSLSKFSKFSFSSACFCKQLILIVCNSQYWVKVPYFSVFHFSVFLPSDMILESLENMYTSINSVACICPQSLNE